MAKQYCAQHTSAQKNSGVKYAAFATLLLLLLSISSLSAHAVVRPNVIVSSFEIKEGSAQVGKEFTLILHLHNVNPNACAMTVTTNIQASAPFILDGVSTIPAGDLCYTDEKTLEVPLRIDATAAGGTYPLTITTSYETTLLAQFSTTNIINIHVAGTPQLTARIIGSMPTDIYPGDDATLNIQIENAGSYAAQTTTATLRSTKEDAKEIEIKTAGSTTSIGTIDARESKTASFNIAIQKDAPAKEYALTLTATYLDENLVQQTQSIPLILDVNKKAQFETTDAGSDKLFAADSTKTIKFTLSNTGTDTAHKLRIKMLPQYPFSTDGSVRYIEALEPGKTAPIEFTTTVDKDGTEGTYGLDLLVDYEDAQGKKLQETAKVALVLEHKSIFRKIFIDYWFLWLVAIVFLGISSIKKMKKTRSAANSSTTKSEKTKK